HVSSWVALLAGITFNNAGYLAENFRGGLKAVPETQMKAARSLGMSAFQAYRLIIVPQLLRIVFHPLSNQMVWAVLMTSLGVVVGLNNDLTGVTQDYNVKTFRTFEYFAIAAVLYYLIAKTIVLVARLMAWRLFRYGGGTAHVRNQPHLQRPAVHARRRLGNPPADRRRHVDRHPGRRRLRPAARRAAASDPAAGLDPGRVPQRAAADPVRPVQRHEEHRRPGHQRLYRRR